MLTWKFESGPRDASAEGAPDDVGPAWLDIYGGDERVANERIADGEWITRAEALRLAQERGYEFDVDG